LGFSYYDIAKKPTIEEMDKNEIYDELFNLLKKVGGMKRAKEICPEKIDRILARIDKLTEEENSDYWFL
jgi:hypothetical protein